MSSVSNAQIKPPNLEQPSATASGNIPHSPGSSAAAAADVFESSDFVSQMNERIQKLGQQLSALEKTLAPQLSLPSEYLQVRVGGPTGTIYNLPRSRVVADLNSYLGKVFQNNSSFHKPIVDPQGVYDLALPDNCYPGDFAVMESYYYGYLPANMSEGYIRRLLPLAEYLGVSELIIYLKKKLIEQYILIEKNRVLYLLDNYLKHERYIDLFFRENIANICIYLALAKANTNFGENFTSLDELQAIQNQFTSIIKTYNYKSMPIPHGLQVLYYDLIKSIRYIRQIHVDLAMTR